MNRELLNEDVVSDGSSLKRQIVLVLTSITVIILIINLSLFFTFNRQIGNFDDVYSSNEFNTAFSSTVDNVQFSMKEYMLTKDTAALSDYYIYTEELRSLCENMHYSIEDKDILMMQHDVVELTYEYLTITEEAMQNKRGRNVIKYRGSYEDATKIFGYLKDYIYSLNTMQFTQNTDSYSVLRYNMQRLEIVCITILILVTGVEYLITSYMVNRITTPLVEITDKAKEVSEGNLDVEFTYQDRHDEIGVLASAFSAMITNIKQHMVKEKKAIEEKRDIRERELRMQAKVKDAELRYYQAQMDPHFLFNTLNAGMQLAMLEGAPRTSEYVGNVAQFFRYNLKKDNGITTLADEIRLVDYYMSILDVRFGGDIKLHKEIDESLCEIEMPKMILQPIVENAVNHGLRDMEDGGQMYLSVYKKDGDVYISVADNGKGMTSETIKEVMAGTYTRKKNSDSSNGVGLKNIMSRLDMFFKRQGVLELISEGEDKGLEVLIHIKQ